MVQHGRLRESREGGGVLRTITEVMTVLAICGSLRHESTNSNALKALAMLVPDVEVYDELASLPPFNPDLDVEGAIAPRVVAALRDRIRGADGVVISTPEYAHGMPGVLKNMLDWLVSDGTLVGKRVVVINATPPAQFAHAQLVEVLKTMNWDVVATVELPLRGRRLTPEQITAEPQLQSAISALNANR